MPILAPVLPLPVSLSSLSSTCDALQEVTPGKIAFTKPTVAPQEAMEQVALFKPADLRESSLKLRPGDKVEFSIVQQDTVTEDLAADVTLVSRASAGGGPDGKPLMGCVISVKEGFGFIRCAILHPAWGEHDCRPCSKATLCTRTQLCIFTVLVSAVSTLSVDLGKTMPLTQ